MPPSLETGRVRDSESTPEGSVSVLTEVTGRDEQPHLPVNHSLPYPGLLLSKCSLGCKPRSCPSFCPFSLTPPAPNYSSSSFCDSPDITLQLRALLLPLNAADCKSAPPKRPQLAATCVIMMYNLQSHMSLWCDGPYFLFPLFILIYKMSMGTLIWKGFHEGSMDKVFSLDTMPTHGRTQVIVVTILSLDSLPLTHLCQHLYFHHLCYDWLWTIEAAYCAVFLSHLKTDILFWSNVSSIVRHTTATGG